MKATGIVRKIDDLGRIVLPIELRRGLDIAERDPVEIFVEGDTIVLKKYKVNCTFCGGDEGLVEWEGKHICANCLAKLKNL